MGEYIGNKMKFEVYGSSHGHCVGLVANGFEKGFVINSEDLKFLMDRRSPGKSRLESDRQEDDEIEFISGVTDGALDGNSLRLEIKNKDVRKSDYDDFKYKPRPGSADYTSMVKFGLESERSGGGQFSGRMTAPMCALGGIIMQILETKGINIVSRLVSVGTSVNPPEFRSIIENAKNEGDSVGAVVECRIIGVPAGTGDMMFGGLESVISKLVFGIPGVKGIEFGSGFEGSKMMGSQNNDQMAMDDGMVTFLSNNAGGILGGLATGEDIIFRVAFKPTSSIAKKQKTIDMRTMTDTEIEISGRHDPCIAIRALPVVEAVSAIAIYDLL